MTALIPINLTEAIGPEELEGMLELAVLLKQTPEQVLVAALKDYLRSKRHLLLEEVGA